MTTVRISYDPDLSKIGTIREVDPVEARLLVGRGRATYVRDQPAAVSEPPNWYDEGGSLPDSSSVTDAVADAQERLNDARDEQAESTSLDLDDDAS